LDTAGAAGFFLPPVAGAGIAARLVTRPDATLDLPPAWAVAAAGAGAVFFTARLLLVEAAGLARDTGPHATVLGCFWAGAGVGAGVARVRDLAALVAAAAALDARGAAAG
jgi:hypothetical protein